VRRRRRLTDRESFFRHLAEVAGDDDKTAVLQRIGRARGWLDSKGETIQEATTAYSSMNDAIRQAARPSARTERLTRQASGRPEE
jgi:hypothetical protein